MAEEEGAGRLVHFAAGMAHQYHQQSRSSHEMGNDLSLREAQHMLTMPSDVFHSSINSGLDQRWDCSNAGMPC